MHCRYHTLRNPSHRPTPFWTGRSKGTIKTSAVDSTKTDLKRVKLGKSDLLVTEVCLGCMKFGSQNDEVESHSILNAAFDRGVNFFDTSEIYPVSPTADTIGRSSLYLGSWLKRAQIKREDVIIATKVTGYSPKEQNGYVAAARVHSNSVKDCRLDKESIEAAIDTELFRLGVDYIDLMQTHWPDRYVPNFGRVDYLVENERESIPFEEQVETMDRMIKNGKIRYWGTSNETAYGMMKICQVADALHCPRPITIQNSFSLINRCFFASLVEVCTKRHLDIPLLPWSPGAGGVLSGKYLNGQFPKGSRMAEFGERYERFLQRKVMEAVAEYVEIAKRFDVTPIQLAYHFCKAQPFVGSTIIGASNLDQLQEDLDGFTLDLPQEALDAINEVHERNPNPQNLYI